MVVISLKTSNSDSEITGSLQAKILMALRDKKLCGVDLMSQLQLKSPGTIYPVLDQLRKKGLIDFTIETKGPIRKKVYFLSDSGSHEIHEYLTRSAKFCCDISKYVGYILENAKGLIEIKHRQKILSTLDYDIIRQFLKGGDISFSNHLNLPPDTFDVILSFLGVGFLIGQAKSHATDYAGQLFQILKPEGQLLLIEIEKTDNLFSRILLEDYMGINDSPGLHSEELISLLEKTGFILTKVVNKQGLLYALAQKPKFILN